MCVRLCVDGSVSVRSAMLTPPLGRSLTHTHARTYRKTLDDQKQVIARLQVCDRSGVAHVSVCLCVCASDEERVMSKENGLILHLRHL